MNDIESSTKIFKNQSKSENWKNCDLGMLYCKRPIHFIYRLLQTSISYAELDIIHRGLNLSKPFSIKGDYYEDCGFFCRRSSWINHCWCVTYNRKCRCLYQCKKVKRNSGCWGHRVHQKCLISSDEGYWGNHATARWSEPNRNRSRCEEVLWIVVLRIYQSACGSSTSDGEVANIKM